MIGACDSIMKADAGPELRHLRALRAVVEEGSFAGAAAVLGCSQPRFRSRSPSWRRTLVFPSFIGAHCDQPMRDESSWQPAMRLSPFWRPLKPKLPRSQKVRRARFGSERSTPPVRGCFQRRSATFGKPSRAVRSCWSSARPLRLTACS